MARCPNCNYALVLLSHRRKYKCAKCGKLFWQKEIDVKEFQEFNKRERKNDKEKVLGKTDKSKQIKLSRFMRKENQRAYRENHREEYNTEKREYWASNHEHLLVKRRENYQMQKAKILAQQALYRQNHKTEVRIKYLRDAQKELALKIFESRLNNAYNLQLQQLLPAILLS